MKVTLFNSSMIYNKITTVLFLLRFFCCFVAVLLWFCLVFVVVLFSFCCGFVLKMDNFVLRCTVKHPVSPMVYELNNPNASRLLLNLFKAVDQEQLPK